MIIQKQIILYYFHDPMCSWCWGYRPTWELLQKNLFKDIKVEYVLGGLAPDTDEVMPVQMQNAIQGYWKKIHKELGAEFNFAFWTQCVPKRSTYKSCRAVIAAKNQNREYEMIYAIQKAYYFRAMNPSETKDLHQLAEELKLDVPKFSVDLESEYTKQNLKEQIAKFQQMPVTGFPSLVLSYKGTMHAIAIDYKNYKMMLDEIRLRLDYSEQQ